MIKKNIKVVALDIYGTVLASGDPNNELPPRKGLKAFLDKCDARRIKVVTASDGHLKNLKRNLQESGLERKPFPKRSAGAGFQHGGD